MDGQLPQQSNYDVEEKAHGLLSEDKQEEVGDHEVNDEEVEYYQKDHLHPDHDLMG